ncbi:hypothetical protein K4F52_005696 [Lecanicillium sp. MT-2017a]|nr:hypothetical protein K4F52_005696 [Lecanicillium sp. MT-2017a]
MRHLIPLIGVPALAASQQLTTSAKPSFDWSKVHPSTDLEYHACYDGFQCARLTVPFDWLNETDPRVAAIAVIKLPAVVPDTDPSFAGPVLTNPGGPGGSGVDLALGDARRVQGIIDKPGERHHEIISFDPRGIANSSPRANCLPHNDLARDAFAYEERGIGALDGSKAAVPRLLAMYGSFGYKCDLSNAAGDPGAEIMGYMSTPSVCRDMVQIIDKIDELRKRQAGEAVDVDVDEDEEDRLELKKRGDAEDGKDVPRLKYIGYSYGTLLGNYFASLFPERIGRLVLDGVADVIDYSSGPGWQSSTIDTEKIVDAFYSGCHAAGSSVCPLVRDSDKSGNDIQARVEDLIAAITDEPLAVITPGGTITTLSGSDIRLATAISLYAPMRTFKKLAVALDGIMTGNTTAFLNYFDGIGAFPHLEDACKLEDNIDVAISQLAENEGSLAVRCSDGGDVTEHNATWWRSYVDEQFAQSPTLGNFWSRIRLPCSSFRFRTNWRFTGPFRTPAHETTQDGKPVKGKPAAPLLFMTSRFDPVTPLRSARRMAAEHPGAAVVVQESLGHTALGTGDSECVNEILREYFDTGRVPDGETVCEAKCGPWDECNNATAAAFGVNDVRRRSLRLPLGI